MLFNSRFCGNFWEVRSERTAFMPNVSVYDTFCQFDAFHYTKHSRKNCYLARLLLDISQNVFGALWIRNINSKANIKSLFEYKSVLRCNVYTYLLRQCSIVSAMMIFWTSISRTYYFSSSFSPIAGSTIASGRGTRRRAYRATASIFPLW